MPGRTHGPQTHRWPLPGLALMRVAGRSMLPALRPGDCVLVRRRARVRPGAVVVVRRPDRPELLVVKRAVTRLTRGWWVAGDNPSESDDSRVFGVVPDELVVGVVLVRYWPPRRPVPPSCPRRRR